MDGHRGQTHDRAVACAVRVGGTRQGVACAPETLQCRRSCNANIKATPVAGHVAFIMPKHVALHLVMRVKPIFDKAGRQAQGHAGVVRPLTGQQLERTATYHVGHRCEGTTRLEFDRRANGIANGQAQQGTKSAVETVFNVFLGHTPPFSSSGSVLPGGNTKSFSGSTCSSPFSTFLANCRHPRIKVSRNRPSR